MSHSKGFGTQDARRKDKLNQQKVLKQIRDIVRGKNGTFQELQRIASGNQEVQASAKGDNLPNDEAGTQPGSGNQNCNEPTHSEVDSGSGAGDVCSIRIADKHIKEWVQGSGVDPEIVKLNLKSLEGQNPYNYLFYSDKLTRTNTGRLAAGLLARYAHLDDGGWWCSGVNVLTAEDSLWGCFKPNKPRFDEEKQKYCKYEHPPKVLTEIFALKIPHRLWKLVARRFDVALPDNYESLPHSAFWQWVIDHPQIPVIITEGCKKAAAVLSCGYVCIALPGVWNGISQPKDEHGNLDGRASLIPQLAVFAQEGRRIYFCFDQDSKRETVRSVNKALTKTAKLFITQKCQVKVITWNPSLGKGIDDFLAGYGLFVTGEEMFDDIYRYAATFDEWQTKQLSRLTHVPDMIINQRYLGEILPPSDAQLICIKAPKNTGKTTLLKYVTEPQIRSGERKVLLITHRVQLGLQTSASLGIPFVSQLKDTEQGSLFGYALCIDSLHPLSQAKFNPQQWRGATVIIDEVQQVIWHLLDSKTCQHNRVTIIKNLKELLQTVVATGGKVIIADADLNDIGIDFIESLVEVQVKKFILVNEFKFNEPWTINRFSGKDPSLMINELDKRLKAGDKAMLCCSAQKAKSKWGTTVLEEKYKRKFPELKILRIDSESVSNPQHPAFGCTADLNKIIVEYDLVISSPTIETGVSIDAKHFDGVWLIGQGVQTTDGVRQFLSRVRQPVPRYVWIKCTGLSFVGNRSTTPAGLIGSEKQKDKSNKSNLVNAGLTELPDGNFSPISLETWAKLGAIINTGMWKYEETILKDLEEEGHRIIDWDKRPIDDAQKEQDIKDAKAVKEEVTQVRDEVYEQHREDVAASDSLTDSQFERLNKQQQQNTDERRQLQKASVERKYLVPVTPDLIKKDDDRWLPKLNLHYLWTVGRQYLSFKDEQFFERNVTNGGGDYFMPDSNKGLKQNGIAMLDYLGLDRLYQDTGFHNDHPVITDILEKITKNLYYIKLFLHSDFKSIVSNPKKRIECIQMLLALFGHKMACIGRKGAKGKQVRYYSSPAPEFQKDKKKKLVLGENNLPIPLDDGREEIYKAWLLRDAELKRKVDEERAKVEAVKNAALAASEAERQEWLSEESIQDIAEQLQDCESSEELQVIRSIIPSYALKLAAASLLAEVKRIQIFGWVTEQNAALAVA